MKKNIRLHESVAAQLTVYADWPGGLGWVYIDDQIDNASLEVKIFVRTVGGYMAAAEFQQVVPGLDAITTAGIHPFSAPAGEMRFLYTSLGGAMATGAAALLVAGD